MGLHIHFLLPDPAEILRSPYGNPAGYPHGLIAIAEGLRMQGVSYSSNIPFWRENLAGSQLFPGPRDCPSRPDVLVMGNDWVDFTGLPLPDEITKSSASAPLKVLVDSSDSPLRKGVLLETSHWRYFDLILLSHCSKRLMYPPTVQPWAFGLTSRLIEATKGERTENASAIEILWNFRHKARPHTLRLWAEKRLRKSHINGFRLIDSVTSDQGDQLDKYAAMMAQQTGGRHSKIYFRLLRECPVIACFCGWLEDPWIRNGVERTLTRQLLERVLIYRRKASGLTIRQWDSWRLWESFAVGACALHVDFEKYGIMMPVMPTNGVHYVGLDLDDIPNCLSRLLPNHGTARLLGQAGRTWALDNYGPEATARRFLAAVQTRLPSK